MEYDARLQERIGFCETDLVEFYDKIIWIVCYRLDLREYWDIWAGGDMGYPQGGAGGRYHR